MDEARLKKLLEIFAASEADELEVEHSFWRGTRIRICRHSHRSIPSPANPTAVSAASSPSPTSSPPPSDATQKEDLYLFTSPMVGTFYRASSPEAEPFVREGDRVKVGQTLCIIEAMKVMNEVPADVEGEIVAILVNDGEPVEYGQSLFKLRPL